MFLVRMTTIFYRTRTALQFNSHEKNKFVRIIINLSYISKHFMSKIEIKHPDKSVSTGAYSAGILMDGWLFISGQGPVNLSTGEVVRGTIEEETLLTLSHVKKIIEAASGSIEDIVKCTVHLSDINDFEK